MNEWGSLNSNYAAIQTAHIYVNFKLSAAADFLHARPTSNPTPPPSLVDRMAFGQSLLLRYSLRIHVLKSQTDTLHSVTFPIRTLSFYP